MITSYILPVHYNNFFTELSTITFFVSVPLRCKNRKICIFYLSLAATCRQLHYTSSAKNFSEINSNDQTEYALLCISHKR